VQSPLSARNKLVSGELEEGNLVNPLTADSIMGSNPLVSLVVSQKPDDFGFIYGSLLMIFFQFLDGYRKVFG
jgi:hypothetical protein